MALAVLPLEVWFPRLCVLAQALGLQQRVLLVVLVMSRACDLTQDDLGEWLELAVALEQAVQSPESEWPAGLAELPVQADSDLHCWRRISPLVVYALALLGSSQPGPKMSWEEQVSAVADLMGRRMVLLQRVGPSERGLVSQEIGRAHV